MARSAGAWQPRAPPALRGDSAAAVGAPDPAGREGAGRAQRRPTATFTRGSGGGCAFATCTASAARRVGESLTGKSGRGEVWDPTLRPQAPARPRLRPFPRRHRAAPGRAGPARALAGAELEAGRAKSPGWLLRAGTQTGTFRTDDRQVALGVCPPPSERF